MFTTKNTLKLAKLPILPRVPSTVLNKYLPIHSAAETNLWLLWRLSRAKLRLLRASMRPRTLGLSVQEEELGLWWRLPEAFAGDKVFSTHQYGSLRGIWDSGHTILPLSLVILGGGNVASCSKNY